MKYEVTYSCGHTGWIDIGGKGAEREKRINYLEHHGLCPDCYKAAQEAKNAAKKEKFGLCELSGTPKQVAWAEKIRAEWFDWTNYITEPSALFKTVMNYAATAITEAKWWIEHRQLDKETIVSQIFEVAFGYSLEEAQALSDSVDKSEKLTMERKKAILEKVRNLTDQAKELAQAMIRIVAGFGGKYKLDRETIDRIYAAAEAETNELLEQADAVYKCAATVLVYKDKDYTEDDVNNLWDGICTMTCNAHILASSLSLDKYQLDKALELSVLAELTYLGEYLLHNQIAEESAEKLKPRGLNE